MAGYLPDMQNLDIRPVLQAYESGVESARKDQEGFLNKRVGETAANSGLEAASKVAFQGGNLNAGLKLSEMSLDRQSKALDWLARGAQAADTPEKWQQFIAVQAKNFGPDSVKGFEGFSSRESAIKLSMTALQQAQLKLQQEAAAREAKKAAGEGIPPGFEPNPAGGVRPIAGGPADPKYMADANEAKRQPNKMTISDITKLSEEAGKFGTLNSVADSFKPEFAGEVFFGNARNWVGRNLPESMVDPNVRAGAAWWQQYDRYKNTVRHELFGSALTSTEQRAWEAADITPNMQPDQVKKNLEIQKNISANGMKRKAGAMVQAGYDPQAISAAYGVKLEDIGVKNEKSPKKAAEPAAQTWTDPVTKKTYKVKDGQLYE